MPTFSDHIHKITLTFMIGAEPPCQEVYLQDHLAQFQSNQS